MIACESVYRPGIRCPNPAVLVVGVEYVCACTKPSAKVHLCEWSYSYAAQARCDFCGAPAKLSEPVRLETA